MRCLVLGGSGFLGAHLTKELINEGYSVIVYDHKPMPEWLTFSRGNKVEFIQGELNDLRRLGNIIPGIDFVFHLISTTVPKTSNDSPVVDLEQNLIPTIKLFDILKSSRIKKVVFFSSGGTVYGIPTENVISEDHPTNPISSYGIHKLTIEKYLYLYKQLYGMDYSILRIANPYGPGQSPLSGQGVIAAFLHKALAGQPIEIWGDGSVVRDYVYVSDVARAAVKVLDYEGSVRIFNVGSGKGRSLTDITASIEKVIGYPLDIIFKESRVFDVPCNILSIKRAERELDWQARVELSEGLREMVQWVEFLLKNDDYK